MLKGFVAYVALTAVIAASQAPKTESIAGTWVIMARGHQIGLGLEQDGPKLTGTLVVMGKSIPVDGEFNDGALKLSTGPDEADPITLTGKLKDDGTLEGLTTTRHGTMTWTAERLKPPQ